MAEVAAELPIKRRATLMQLQRLEENDPWIRSKRAGETLSGGSAAPLRGLIGLVDDEGAERVKERSQAFREEFDERNDRCCVEGGAHE